MEALGIIGFFGMVVGIVWLIVSFFKRSRKRFPLLMVLGGFVLLVIGVSATSFGQVPENTNQELKETRLFTGDARELVLRIDDFN